MISKHVPMRSLQKSNIAELVRYITDSQGKQERVGQISITNCHGLTPDDAILEMLATQACNTRSAADKTYHLLVSFADGENPPLETLRAIEARLCDALGYGEHQRVSAIHHDTDHVHIHIAINKIHPERHTIHTPLRDYKIRAEVCKQLEHEFGLTRVDHTGRKTVGQGRAADMEHHAGVESLMSWVRRECLPQLNAATTWQQVHDVLGERQLIIKQRGAGFVIGSPATSVYVKASSVDRVLSMQQLERRIGFFRPDNNQWSQKIREANPGNAHAYGARPIGYSAESTALYARYQADRAGIQRHSQAALNAARAKRTADLEALASTVKVRQAAIKLLAPQDRRVMYRLLSAAAKRRRTKIRTTFQKERATAVARYPRRTFADWLRHQAHHGDPNALRALRTRDMKRCNPLPRRGMRPPVSKPGRPPPHYRRGIMRPLLRIAAINLHLPALKPKVAPIGTKPPPQSQGRLRPLSQLRAIPLQRATPNQKPMGFETKPLQKDGTTKRGTIIFRAGPTAVRDDGKQVHVSRGASDLGLLTALQLATERFGPKLKVSGSDTFKQRIVRLAVKHRMPVHFADPAMESARVHSMTTPPQQGDTHEQQSHTDGRGAVGRSPGGTRAGHGGARAGTPAAGLPRREPDSGGGRKPNIGRVGTKPPAQSKERLRNLSELGVVHDGKRSEVLLPRDVPRDMEQQGTARDHGVRRALYRAGMTDKAEVAVARYIDEREAKRARGLNIPEHKRYTGQDAGDFRYAGIRRVEDEHLALLERGGTISVLPLAASQVPRMKRRSIGETVTVSANGAIKSKGRNRGKGT